MTVAYFRIQPKHLPGGSEENTKSHTETHDPQSNCNDHMIITSSIILDILKTNFQYKFPTIFIFNNTSNFLLLASPENLP